MKDIVVLQGLWPSSNYLHMKSKSTMLWALIGEVGYELAAFFMMIIKIKVQHCILRRWQNIRTAV